jgi:hypothetical protein
MSPETNCSKVRASKKGLSRETIIAMSIKNIDVFAFAPAAYTTVWKLDPNLGVTCLGKYISSANGRLENRKANGRRYTKQLLDPVVAFLESPGAIQAFKENYLKFANEVYPEIQKLGWEGHLQKVGFEVIPFKQGDNDGLNICYNTPTKYYSISGILRYC